MRIPIDQRVYAPGRRRFISRVPALGTLTLLGGARLATAAEPPPETTRIRLVHVPAICFAPQYLAEEFLRLEGFTEVEYVQEQVQAMDGLASGRADITMDATPAFLPALDQGKPVVVLAGIHAGCYELFGHGGITAIRDLKGMRAAVSRRGAIEHIYLSSMLAYVGISPDQVKWVEAGSNPDAMRLFAERKADAFLGFAPQPQELRARKIGRVIVNMTEDRPWSQYFCCSLGGNREFVTRNPIATKRALRAYLKAADACSKEPERVARFLEGRKYEPRYEIGLEVLRSLPYDRWRNADPEDTVRFHALRLREVGMIKSAPQKLIEQGTDWRFLKELKQQLKV